MNEDQSLAYIPIRRMLGTEEFVYQGQQVGSTLLEFWQWAFSELAGNTLRGTVAEYIVAMAAGLDKGVQIPWDACDLRLPGGRTLEIKTSGYLQTWKQSKLGRPSWSIAKSKAWDPQTNEFALEPKRNSDTYVFCLHHHTDKSTINPLELDQWTFFVVPTAKIEATFGARTRVGIRELNTLGATGLNFQDLRSSLALI